MAMELEGRIARKLAVQTGTSARGAWSKQEFVLEYQDGSFPAQVCMNVWGDDKVKELDKYQVGDQVKVSVKLSSREYNGRWYTDVRAWRIEPAGAQQAAPAGGYAAPASGYGAPASPQVASAGMSGAAPVPSAPLPTADDMSSPLDDNDLPF